MGQGVILRLKLKGEGEKNRKKKKTGEKKPLWLLSMPSFELKPYNRVHCVHSTSLGFGGDQEGTLVGNGRRWGRVVDLSL